LRTSRSDVASAMTASDVHLDAETHGIEMSGGTRCPRHLDRTGSRPLQI
jgi:hypothetical protein